MLKVQFINLRRKWISWSHTVDVTEPDRACDLWKWSATRWKAERYIRPRVDKVANGWRYTQGRQRRVTRESKAVDDTRQIRVIRAFRAEEGAEPGIFMPEPYLR